MSLRAKFLALFAALAVAPLIAIGIFDYLHSMRALEALVATQVGAIAERAARELADQYALRESDLLLLAENAETQVSGLTTYPFGRRPRLRESMDQLSIRYESCKSRTYQVGIM